MRSCSPVAYILLYATMYAAFGVASPFWPKVFESKGLIPEQIGLILGLALVMRLAAGPVVGRLADLLVSLRLLLATCLIVAAAAAATLLPANTFWLLLFVALVQGAALAPTTSLADALAVSTATPSWAGRPFEYGWIRGSASTAFVLGTLATGQLIGPSDLSPVIWMNVGLLLVAAAVTAALPKPLPTVDSRSSVLPMTDVRELLKLTPFRAVIVVAALIYGSHALYDAFAVIRWSNAGLPASVISLLWAEAVAAEVVVFFFIGPRIVDRFGPRQAALLAAVAGVIRWSVMGLTNSLALLAVLQPLHGLTFALLHLTCMRLIAGIVPPRLAATAQASYALGAGVVTALLTSASGPLYAGYGGLAFLPMAVLCLVALPFAWLGFEERRLFRDAS